MAALVPYLGSPYATTSGTADMVMVVDEAHSYSSNMPDPPARSPEDPDVETELKALARARNRERSLNAVRTLQGAHNEAPTTSSHLVVTARVPRPSRRRTATAVRNFRSQA